MIHSSDTADGWPASTMQTTRDQIARAINDNHALGPAAALDAVMAVVADALRDEAAQTLLNQTQLKGMTVEDGALVLQLGPPRELVIAFVDAARKMLGDAPNYSETVVEFPAVSMEIKAGGEFERYAFIVQRVGKLTPHQARQEAEAARDELRARLAQLESQGASTAKRGL